MAPEEATPPPEISWQQVQSSPQAWRQVQSSPELGRKVAETLDTFLEPYLERMGESSRRVASLLQIAEGSIPSPLSVGLEKYATANAAAQDVFRAAVVFIHAYLEDFLRTVAGVLLPDADEATLNTIPLAGLGRAEKFPLGKLVQHKGKLVEEVLRMSVTEYLDRSTFNSTVEISLLLEKLGFQVADHNERFPSIGAMIQRRHQIVHRADRVKGPGSEKYTLQPIEAGEVWAWLRDTTGFMISVTHPLFRKLNPLEEIMKKALEHEPSKIATPSAEDPRPDPSSK